MKKLLTTALLALSLAVPACIMPAFAEETAGGDIMSQLEQYYEITPYYVEDFEGYGKGEALSSIWSATNNQELGSCLSPGQTPTAPKGTSLAVQAGGFGNNGTEVSVYFTEALSGTVMVKCDFYFTESDKHDKVILPMNDKDNRNENNILEAKKNGNLTCPRENGKVLSVRNEPGKWYEVIAVLDTVGHTFDMYINGEQVVTKAASRPEANGIRRIFPLKQWGAEPVNINYIDNFGVYTLKPYPTAVFAEAVAGDKTVADAQAIPYDTDEIHINLTSAFTSDAVDGKIGLTKDNQPVEVDGNLSDDGLTYTMTVKELLEADCEYTIAFAPGMADKAGVGLVTERLPIKTAANTISKVVLSKDGSAVKPGETITATADALFLENAPTHEVLLMLVLYKNNRFEAVAYTKETVAGTNTIAVSIDVPIEAGNYMVKAFAWDNATDMNAYTN